MSLATLKDCYSSPYRIKQCTVKLPEDRKRLHPAKL